MSKVNIGISVSLTEIHYYVIKGGDRHAEHFTQSLLIQSSRRAVRDIMKHLWREYDNIENVTVVYNSDSLHIVNYLHYGFWCMSENINFEFNTCYKTEVNELLTKAGREPLPMYHDPYEIPSWEFYGSALARLLPTELIADNLCRSQALCCALIANKGEL